MKNRKTHITIPLKDTITRMISSLRCLIIQNKGQSLLVSASIMIFIVGFALGRVTANPYGKLISNALSNYHKGDWVVKIDRDTIGKEYLDESYATYISINPKDANSPLMKDIVLRKLIDNYVILQDVDKSGMFSSEKFKRYVWFYTEEAMANYYLDALHRLGDDKIFKLDQKQKEEFYQKHKDLFDKQNKNHDEAMHIIDVNVEQMANVMAKKNSVIYERIELGKLKKGKKIIFNTKYLAKEVKSEH